VVYLVDEDPLFRKKISKFLAAGKIKVSAFASATEYLNSSAAETAACVVLNLHLPDLSGLELQQRLASKGNPPVIFISKACDTASVVSAMKAGAIDFLSEPVDLAALLAAIEVALAQDRRVRQQMEDLVALKERLATLTPRQREVFPLVVEGLLNKQAASALGISEVTLQVHRSQVMRKMNARCLADLVRMAAKLSL
jgi:FixJ family two-component response regulator